MDLFRWNDEYSVGIETIDKEHQSLFKLLNEVFNAMKQGKATEILSEIVGRLHAYARSHFRREEFYFKTTDYPNMDKHKAEHDEFMQKVNHYKDELAKGNNTFTLDVVGFIREWLVKHIKGSDMAYKEYLKRYGIR